MPSTAGIFRTPVQTKKLAIKNIFIQTITQQKQLSHCNYIKFYQNR